MVLVLVWHRTEEQSTAEYSGARQGGAVLESIAEMVRKLPQKEVRTDVRSAAATWR